MDGGLFTALTATAADHAIPGQAIVPELNQVGPRRLRRIGGKSQGLVTADLYAFTTKTAAALTEVDLWVTTDTTMDDPGLAMVNTFVTAHATLHKQLLYHGPGRPDGGMLTAQVAAEKLGSVDGCRHDAS